VAWRLGVIAAPRKGILNATVRVAVAAAIERIAQPDQ
jgi:hypothetical protein